MQESPEAYYCPYCSATAEVDNWYTAQQQEYIQEQAMTEIVGPNLYRLQEQLEQACQSGLFRIEMTSPVLVEPEPLVEFDDMTRLEFPCHVGEPIKVDELWDQEVACVMCGTCYPIDKVRTLSREEVGEKLRMEQEEREHPPVFVSHASEDKDRFVTEFATKLRASGINAWLDKWEIQPGDSLVDKVFEKGIRAAQIVVIILSSNSIKKPWVKAEVEASIVKRIEEGIRIIPIVLDGLVGDEIPTALKPILYVRIPDFQNYDAELKRIIGTIYGYSDKPALGSAPAYIQNPIEQIPGLSRIDSLVLKMAGDKAIENGYRVCIETQEMLSQATLQEISPYQFYESLAMLRDGYYLELHTTMGGEPSDLKLRELVRGGLPDFSLTIDGFEKYAKAYISEYKAIVRDVHLQIVNEGKSDSASIAESIKQPLMVVEHVLERLDRSGDIKMLREFNGGITTHFMNPSPRLRRRLEQWNAASGNGRS
jgi:TIR domain